MDSWSAWTAWAVQPLRGKASSLTILYFDFKTRIFACDKNFDSELEDNIRSELLQDSEYEYMYCEGIKAENINPVSTPFTDWIDQIINYDGIGSIISGYDGELNYLSDDSVWFRRN